MASTFFTSVSRFMQRLLPLFLLLRIGSVSAQNLIVHDEGYRTYITRPEFRAPKVTVETYKPDQLSEGYWFIAPYPELGREKQSWSWPVCPFGAHIIDSNGELVWGGACEYDNRNVFDFKVSKFQDKDYLSMAVLIGPSKDPVAGAGLVLNNNYKVVRTVEITDKAGEFNNHEFHMINNGKSALAITSERKHVETPELGIEGESRVEFNGFLEIDVDTSKVIFNWTSEGHLPLDECTETWLRQATPQGAGWDYVHMNSVDKFANGDYLISCRHTDSIYRIDGKNGDIKWRMGGNPRQTRGEYKLEGFTFSRQHNARILDENHENGTFTMSFLDNAAGNNPNAIPPTNDHSTGYIVHVDEKKKTVTRLDEYPRPDGRISYAKGNVQILPNGNIFVGWAEQGLMSEYSRDGTLLQTAAFPLFSTYRAYKYPFTGYPTEIPVMKAFAYGTSDDDLNTIVHVSWNGATEVGFYNFYAADNANVLDKRDCADNGNAKAKRKDSGNDKENANASNSTDTEGLTLIGTAQKQGFETVFMYDGYVSYVVAEALDKNGKPLPSGITNVTVVEVPDWKAAGFEGAAVPTPDAHPGVHSSLSSSDDDNTHSVFEIFIVLVGAVIVCGIITGVVWFVKEKQQKDGKGQGGVQRSKYSTLPDDVEAEEIFRCEDEDLEKGAELGDSVRVTADQGDSQVLSRR